MMRRDDIISRIRKDSDAIRAEGAIALYLFGSIARDQAQADSDIDVFVDYDPKRKFSLLNMSGSDSLSWMRSDARSISPPATRYTPA